MMLKGSPLPGPPQAATLLHRQHVVCVDKVGQSYVNAAFGADDAFGFRWPWAKIKSDTQIFNREWMEAACGRVQLVYGAKDSESLRHLL